MTETNGTAPKVSLSVRDYVDLAITHERELNDERQRFIGEKFLTIEESRRLAKIEQDRRLEQMNEFREENRKLTSTFVTREVHEKDLGFINIRLSPLVSAAERQEGFRGVQHWLAPNAPVLISLGIAIVALLLALAGR